LSKTLKLHMVLNYKHPRIAQATCICNATNIWPAMAVQWPFLCMAVAPPLTEEEQKTHSNDGDVITAESDVSDGSFIADHPVQ